MTYSIVARDKKTGELGVAVQSHYFSVGSVVTWARAGVGAVATQSIAEPSYGPLGLELMGAGKSASEALEALLRVDKKADHRQVAMVDSRGGVAAHTGGKCIPHAGQVSGEQFSCQANLMRNDSIWGAMKESYQKNEDAPLAERLVEALQAGEEAGGDVRGKQSAAILVVSGQAQPSQWAGRVMDLRVEDNPDPIPELRRLVRYKRGYDWVDKGDEYLASRDYPNALEAYRKGLELVPEVDELRYWVGLSYLATSEKERGRDMLREVFKKDGSWVQLTRDLVRTQAVPVDPASIQDLLS
ncbi:MAG: DUF1028 domain-containing protein [Thaumarchaeota archaeon]|nr:DUF1028 domain-containing protein [Nitrososphaerota archaeon]